MSSKEHIHKGREVTVRWDAVRCLHAAECLRRLPTVFDVQRRVWVTPNAASADEVSETVVHCPTGALHVERSDGIKEEPPQTNNIQLRMHGPLYAHGDLVVRNPRGVVELEDARMALCRCGMSAQKPLCDNSHIPAEFQDYGKLGKPQSGVVDSATGKLTITPLDNGPLELSGRAEIVASDGRSICVASPTLCRCGSSSNKPFCDGSHEKVGFVSGVEEITSR